MESVKFITDYLSVEWQEIVTLYESVNWQAYTQDPLSLREAFKNSTYICLAIDTKEKDKVCGLVRCISDDVSIHYLQDVLINPSFQRRGIGRTLIEMALRRFEHVRTHLLLTDDEPKQIDFYESLGYARTNVLKKVPLNTFVKMKNVKLS